MDPTHAFILAFLCLAVHAAAALFYFCIRLKPPIIRN